MNSHTQPLQQLQANWPPALPTLVDMRTIRNRQFPPYVEYSGSQPITEGLTIVYLKICGQDYSYHPTDKWIDPAIFLSSTWNEGEQTFERIISLRQWLRENEQHGHNLDFSHLRTMKDCLDFIVQLIKLEHSHYIEGEQAMTDLINEHTLLYNS